ncbi:MAG: allantoicase [Terriglobia bacterium]
MTDFTELVDLASARLGGVVLAANDEFFAPKENLLMTSLPSFLEDKYTDRGKWMDGWETRRRRSPGHDWCLIKLGLPGILRGVVVDTSHFTGNHPEQCSLEACEAEAGATLEQLTSPATRWVEVLPPSNLRGDARNRFSVEHLHRVSHIRFNIFPDGGVARLRVYGEALPDWEQLASSAGDLDLAAVENGGLVVAASDMFFGSRHNLILPGRARNMSEGWETRRRRGPGHDWAIIKLGTSGTVHRVEVNTAYFKGNFPESCSLEGCQAEGASLDELTRSSASWNELLARSKLKANSRHFFEKEIKPAGPVTHVRFNIFPDGGVSRLRLFGRPGQERGWEDGLRRLNALPGEEAEAALLACCGSSMWARRMAGERPFGDRQELLGVSDRIWGELGRQDWLEAFSRHPRIGEKRAAKPTSPDAQRWSEKEQAGTRGAAALTLAALQQANRDYEARFGHIFIVCASGKSTEEMLELLRQRLQNDADTELRLAAEEQRRITHLRLEKLLEP